MTNGVADWSFLRHFNWTPPPPTTPSWLAARPLIDAALSRHSVDLARVERWLTENDAHLADLGGDPLRDDWSSFRPLRLSREEDWSDWLAHLIHTSRSGVFWSTALGNKVSAEASATPGVVKREWSLTGGYRADLGIGLHADDSWMHVEVKIGDDDLKKTIGTGKAMRVAVSPAAVLDVLLLPRNDKPLWDTVIEDCAKAEKEEGDLASLSGEVIVIDWHDIARGLRRALQQSEKIETVTWRVLARTFCGAVEQTIIGLPQVRADSLEALSLPEVERLVRYSEEYSTKCL